MRYRLPDGCTGVTHAGVALPAAADGTIEADTSAAPDLASHGLVPAEDEPKAAAKPKAGKRVVADDRVG